MKRIVLLLSLLIVCTGVQAQFSLTGSDPSKVRWMQMSSPEFRIIYPEGEDSLARVYGTWLEKARIGVSRSSGLLAGENNKRRMPVVLHSFNTIPNASVAWAPRRMDFFTAPDAYSPTPVPWEKLLAIHEGRHVSQMNAGVAGRNKVFKYLTGELFAGAFAGLYPGPTLLEGDAVVTETALTSSGRGRQASFLSYMMPAFESGDWRDYWKWSFGSILRITTGLVTCSFREPGSSMTTPCSQRNILTGLPDEVCFSICRKLSGRPAGRVF